MTAEIDYLKRAWDYSEDDEIALKQIYAYLFSYFGFTDHKDKDIIKASNFVGSDHSSKPFLSSEKATGSSISFSSDEETKVNLSASDDIKSRFKTLGGYEGVLEQAHKGKSKKHHKHFHTHNHHHKALQKHDPSDLFISFILFPRNENFDIIIKRFFVARKKKVDDVLEMMAKNLDWRINSHQVDRWVNGGDAEVFFKGNSPQFIDAFKINQAFLRGRDKIGRPIVVIHVKDHLGKNCPEREFEKFICILIEWTRFNLSFLQEGVDKACLLFDMTGFSLKNADFAAIKFLATAFEANYPECLGAIWIHSAPWVFNAVWKVIRGWLDPVVALKIHFTKTAEDLEAFVSREYIPKSLGGDDEFNMKYKNPTHEDNEKPKDERYKELIEERDELIISFFETTNRWLQAKSVAESDKYLQNRLILSVKLAQNYIELDPYIRKRSIFERIGEMKEIGY